MILIIGGKGAGKMEHLRAMGYEDKDIAKGVIDDKPVLYGLEEIVFAAPKNAEEMLPELLRKQVIACCEVGSGIIPAERSVREAREATGRLCIALAKEATRVIRMVSGIPQVIK